jgi:nitrite reductase (NADH) small subunit
MSRNADSAARLVPTSAYGFPSSRAEPGWRPVCREEAILPDTGVCALVGGEQVAVFRAAGSVYAIANRDPFTGAQVLSRGLLGDRGGVVTVASPLLKQRFDLATGACLDDPAVQVAAYGCRVRDGMIEVALS